MLQFRHVFAELRRLLSPGKKLRWASSRGASFSATKRAENPVNARRREFRLSAFRVSCLSREGFGQSSGPRGALFFERDRPESDGNRSALGFSQSENTVVFRYTTRLVLHFRDVDLAVWMWVATVMPSKTRSFQPPQFPYTVVANVPRLAFEVLLIEREAQFSEAAVDFDRVQGLPSLFKSV